jgi:hypothetical protein
VHTVCFVRPECTLAATISQRSGARADRITRGGTADAKRGDGALDRSRGGTAGAHDLEIRTEADNAPVQRDIAMVPLASFVARCAIPDDWPVSQTQPTLTRFRVLNADTKEIAVEPEGARSSWNAVGVAAGECRTRVPPPKLTRGFWERSGRDSILRLPGDFRRDPLDRQICLLAQIPVWKGDAEMNSGPTLSTGSTGPDVRRLQRLLIEIKLLDFTQIDGDFGSVTEGAAKDFQARRWIDCRRNCRTPNLVGFTGRPEYTEIS